jgi:hypothetical protein
LLEKKELFINMEITFYHPKVHSMLDFDPANIAHYPAAGVPGVYI